MFYSTLKFLICIIIFLIFSIKFSLSVSKTLCFIFSNSNISFTGSVCPRALFSLILNGILNKVVVPDELLKKVLHNRLADFKLTPPRISTKPGRKTFLLIDFFLASYSAIELWMKSVAHFSNKYELFFVNFNQFSQIVHHVYLFTDGK